MPRYTITEIISAAQNITHRIVPAKPEEIKSLAHALDDHGQALLEHHKALEKREDEIRAREIEIDRREAALPPARPEMPPSNSFRQTPPPARSG